MDGHSAFEAVGDNVLAQEPNVLRSGLERPRVPRAVRAQGEARGRSDVRTDIEEAAPFQAGAQTAPLQLRNGAREQRPVVRAIDERAARDLAVGGAEIEAQTVRVDGDRWRHVTQCIEDVAATDALSLAAEVQRPAGDVRRGAMENARHDGRRGAPCRRTERRHATASTR